MKTIEEICIEIGFTTKAKNYRKAFYDKYIRNLDYKIICEHYDLISIFNLGLTRNGSHGVTLPIFSVS